MYKSLVSLVFLLLLSLSGSTSSSAQERRKNEPLLITGEITGDGQLPMPQGSNINRKGLFVKLTVTNYSEAVRTIKIMSCSWQENWDISNANYQLWSPGCDKNSDRTILLKPGKSITFYGCVVRRIPSISTKNESIYESPRPLYDKWSDPPLSIRFGFTEVCPDCINRFSKIAPPKNNAQVFWWSAPVSLQFDNNTFVEEE